MNGESLYRRQEDAVPQRPLTEPVTDQVSQLAVSGDPSKPAPSKRALPIRSIAWVRPSDLPTVVAGPVIGRGIDLHAELLRRTRRAPLTASARRRITRTSIAQSQTASPTTYFEGISL